MIEHLDDALKLAKVLDTAKKERRAMIKVRLSVLFLGILNHTNGKPAKKGKGKYNGMTLTEALEEAIYLYKALEIKHSKELYKRFIDCIYTANKRLPKIRLKPPHNINNGLV